MSESSFDDLLARLDNHLSSEKSLNGFELRKISKNLDYVQYKLLEQTIDDVEDPSYPSAVIQNIRRCQARLALRKESLEQEYYRDHQPVIGAIEKQTGGNGDELSTQEHILQNHRETQEHISDDLLSMAQALKENQTKFGNAVAADNELIEKTGEALQINSGRMKQTGGRLSKYSRKNSWSWMYTYLAILVALVAFLITTGLIRIT